MSDQFLGEVRMASWGISPKNWALCDGQTLPINQNQALFSLLGTSYGGNGVQTFQLPDLRGRAPVGWDKQNGTNVLGQVGGEEMHTLSGAEYPPHTHAFNGTKSAGTDAQPAANNIVGSYSLGFAPYPAGGKNVTTMAPSTIANAGGSQPHENRQPYVCVNFIIALSGVYPSRS